MILNTPEGHQRAWDGFVKTLNANIAEWAKRSKKPCTESLANYMAYDTTMWHLPSNMIDDAAKLFLITYDRHYFDTSGNTDYFQSPELQPEYIAAILATFDEDADSYNELARLSHALRQYGWTFDYYLDATPFNLHPMTEEETKEYDDQGTSKSIFIAMHKTNS